MIKVTTLTGKEIIFDNPIELNTAINTLWANYEKTGIKAYEIAHTILTSAIWGKIEKI